MVTYLSFASIAPLAQKNTVSPIGELSARSRTFEEDPNIGSVEGSSNVVLYNFLSKDGDNKITMPDALMVIEIGIADWLYDQAKLGNITDSSAGTLAALRANFTQGIIFDAVGEMVTNGSIYLPSIITGKHIVSGVEETFYLWFSDKHFDAQYPSAAYNIVHPVAIDDIDVLFDLNYLQLAERLKLETPDVVNQREKDITKYPPTDRNIISFLVYDLNNNKTTLCYWRVLVNGNYNEDSANEVIRNEIRAKSKYDDAKLGELIPDLFNPNEFYGIPRFDLLGMVNKTEGTSLHSPIVDRESEMKFTDIYLLPNMNADHVIKSTQSVPMLYKSFQAQITAKVNNREGFIKFKDVYPDYSLIPSDDSDFGGMKLKTRELIITLERLVSAAEVVTEFSIPPVNVDTVKRFDKLWVTAKTGGIKFMILTRYQMIQDGYLNE